MMDMNQNIMDARMRVRDNFESGLNPAMRRVMNPAMQYGPAPMDRALEDQAPNNAITTAQQAVAGRAFGNNMARQMSVDPNITSRIF
jgi:hypothetical protein